MKKSIFTILNIIATMISYSQQGLTCDLSSNCMLGIPIYNCSMVQNETNELPVTIISDNARAHYPENIIFSGNVNINQGNTHLQADKVYLHQEDPDPDNSTIPKRIMNAIGNVQYENTQIILKGQKAYLNLNTKDINVWNGDYQMIGRQGRGKADLIKQREKNRYTILEHGGSFTSCLPNSNIWSVLGSKVIHDRERQVIKIWNARFKIGSIPIFYSPYLKFSIGNNRCSGFLVPNAKYSVTNYFEFYLPYYLNISTNMDAIIRPHYIQKRENIMWEKEFRYITKSGIGLMELHYLPYDKFFKKDYLLKNNPHRWLYYWNHVGVMNQVWRFNANYTKVSDPYYFKDFSSQYSSNSDGYTKQMLSVAYAKKNFDATLSTRQFQLFKEQQGIIYDADPQIEANWYQNHVGPFNIRLYGQAVQFINSNPNVPKATRIHFEPTINLPFSNDWASLDTELKLMITNYQQKNIKNYNNFNKVNLEDSINRVLPQFKVDAKIIFERDINQSSGYNQTIESRIQNLYVPYRDQKKINNYDSTFLQTDYIGLFRDRPYGSLDRVFSANQVTTGVTSRVFDINDIERFNISVGQIYHITESRTGDEKINWGKDKKIGSIIFAGDTYWRMSDRWGFRGDMQYDTRLDTFTTSNALVEYRRDDNRMMQLTCRYSSPEYIRAMLPGYMTGKKSNQGISQVGGTACWLLADRLSIVGTYYFNTKTYESADQKLGLQYNSCCYALRIGYERKLNGRDFNSHKNEYDNLIDFNIELRGLNSNSNNLGIQKMLRSNVFPYRSFF